MGRTIGAKNINEKTIEKYEITLRHPLDNSILFQKKYPTIGKMVEEIPYWSDSAIYKVLSGVSHLPGGYEIRKIEQVSHCKAC